jgi:hypothetical protein
MTSEPNCQGNNPDLLEVEAWMQSKNALELIPNDPLNGRGGLATAGCSQSPESVTFTSL